MFSEMFLEQNADQIDYNGKTIDVVGIVDYFSGAYQIKVFNAEDIKIH